MEVNLPRSGSSFPNGRDPHLDVHPTWVPCGLGSNRRGDEEDPPPCQNRHPDPYSPTRLRPRNTSILSVRQAVARPCDTHAVDELIRRFYEDLWNRWDDGLVNDILAEDFIFRGSLGTETHGRDEWRAYRDLIRVGASDFHNEVVTLVVKEEQAAARLLYTGTHTGPLAGLAPTGRRFFYAGAAFFTASMGQLTSAWVLGDLTGLREQLDPST